MITHATHTRKREPAAIAAPAFLTVADVAARLGVDGETVLAWLHAGTLRGVNVARPGCRRPRWRIAAEEFERFLAARTSAPPRSPARPRRQKETAGVIEFFK